MNDNVYRFCCPPAPLAQMCQSGTILRRPGGYDSTALTSAALKSFGMRATRLCEGESLNIGDLQPSEQVQGEEMTKAEPGEVRMVR